MTVRNPLTRLALGCALAAPAHADQLEIASPHVNVGPVVVLTTIEHRYTIRNTGDTPVGLTRWYSPSGVGEVIDLPPRLAPGESAEFGVRIPMDGEPGKFGRRFAIFTDEEGVDRYRFSLSGFAYSVLSPDRPVLTFGDVTRGSKETLAVDLTAQESEPLRLLEVVESPDWADVHIDGQRAAVTINEKLPAGPNGAKVKIRTNLAVQPFAELGIVANGRGGLEASEYYVTLARPRGEVASKTIRVTHPHADLGRDLKVEAEPEWKVGRRACAEPSPHCIEFVLERKVATTGRDDGKFTFRLDAGEFVETRYSILGLAEGRPVRELVVDQNANKSPTADLDRVLSEIRAGAPPEGNGASSAAADMPPPAPDVAPVNSQGPAPVRLVWRARNVEQTYGFLVYRATSRRGPFVRVSEPITARGDGRFEFVDEAVETGSTYYYYVDAIASNGRKSRFSPVMSKTITAE